MRQYWKLILSLLALLCSIPALAQTTALTPPGSPDTTVVKDDNGNTVIFSQGTEPYTSVDLTTAGGATVTITASSSGVTLKRHDAYGNYDAAFASRNIPYDINHILIKYGIIFLVGSSNNQIAIVAIDATTGANPYSANPVSPSTHDYYAWVMPSTEVSPAFLYASIADAIAFQSRDEQRAEKANVGTPRVAIMVVAADATFSHYSTEVYLLDTGTGQLVPSFGTGGYAVIQGNFQGRWIVGTADGLMIGGVSHLDPAHPGIGVANLGPQGNPGTCGGTAKEVLPRTNQFILPDTTGGFFDPGSGLVTFVGEASGSGFFGRQLQANCTLNTTAFTYPDLNVFVGEVAAVTAGTMAVVLNEVGNGTSAARVALYTIATGGAPTAVSPVITSGTVSAVAGPPSGRAAPGKALGVANTYALSLAVQSDAKIVIAGTTDAAGGAAFLARYVGVESTTDVVEFYNTVLNHYFITADPIEAAAIDGGSAGPGWSRTGQTWKSGGPDRVCRFYGVQSAGGPNGHFYTIDYAECAAVMLDPGWHFESYDFSAWPHNSDNSCPPGTIPVKRAYNGRFAQHDSNHRYAINDTIYNQMLAMGWSGEGVVFCSVK